MWCLTTSRGQAGNVVWSPINRDAFCHRPLRTCFYLRSVHLTLYSPSTGCQQSIKSYKYLYVEYHFIKCEPVILTSTDAPLLLLNVQFPVSITDGHLVAPSLRYDFQQGTETLTIQSRTTVDSTKRGSKQSIWSGFWTFSRNNLSSYHVMNRFTLSKSTLFSPEIGFIDSPIFPPKL